MRSTRSRSCAVGEALQDPVGRGCAVPLDAGEGREGARPTAPARSVVEVAVAGRRAARTMPSPATASIAVTVRMAADPAAAAA